MTSVTVAAIQTALTDDAAANIQTIEHWVVEAVKQGAQVVLPPELFEGHYFCQEEREDWFARAHEVDQDPAIAHFTSLAQKLGAVIPISFFEKDGPCYYNSVAVINADGSMLGIYRKSHIPDGPGYEEKYYFRPGNTGFKVWQTRYATLGVGICWDQWFPECARIMTLMGAQVLMYPTAIGSEPYDANLNTKDAWQRAMIGHAVCNSIPIVAANRVGQENQLTFYGASFICDHQGTKVQELNEQESGVIVSRLELDAIAEYRAGFGFFRDRRPDLYKPLLS